MRTHWSQFEMVAHALRYMVLKRLVPRHAFVVWYEEHKRQQAEEMRRYRGQHPE